MRASSATSSKAGRRVERRDGRFVRPQVADVVRSISSLCTLRPSV